ncbi:MAG: tetratricopeptide repeat protein [Deltaproteobacteria bacterium]|nr:tetratricopeptide repeat protein [Deltaproteobacteria bacterium]
MSQGEEKFHHRERFDRKELKRPDEFLSVSAKVLRWVGAHRRGMLGLCGVVFISAGAISGYLYWAERKSERASELYHQIVKELEEIQQLRARQTFPSPEQKGEDRAKDEKRLSELLASASEKQQRMNQKFGDTGIAAFALIEEGGGKAKEGKYDEAAALYKRVLEKKLPSFLKDMAAVNLGYVLEASGKCEEALSAYQKGEGSGYAFLNVSALWGKARCYEILGRKGEAAAIYDKVAAEYPATPYERKSHIFKELQESK